MGLVRQLSVVAGLLIVAALLIGFDPVVGPPVHPNSLETDGYHPNNTDWNLGLPYEKYLQEVIRVLEEDGEFKAKLELAKSEDITSGKISEQLQFVNHRVRNQLDELKRIELHRLRKILKEQAELYNNDGRVKSKGRFRDGRRRGGGDGTELDLPDHVDVSNPHTFEIEDLKRLVMQTTKDLEEVDRRRREEFKAYEMDKELRRRKSLEELDDDKRKQAEQEYEEQQKKHKEHPKLHHPGSKLQLEEVWEEADEMPVEEFEPRTFHSMHDVNGDGYWDYEELSALFIKELNKMYDSKNPEDDMQERHEEMNRMREHVMNETDVNQDGMISLQEFMDMTKRRDFDEDPGWQGIDEEQQFNENEFQEYEKHRTGPHGGAGGIPPGGYVQNGIHPNAEYQHLPPPDHHQQQQFEQMQYQQFQQQQQPPPHMRQQQPNHGYPVQPPQFQGGQPNYQLPQGYQQQPQQGFQQPPQGYQQQQGGYQHQQPHSYEQPQKLGYQQQVTGGGQANQQQPPAVAAPQQAIPSVVQQQAQALPVVSQQPPVPVADQKQALPIAEHKTQPSEAAAAAQNPELVQQQQQPVVKDAGQQQQHSS